MTNRKEQIKECLNTYQGDQANLYRHLALGDVEYLIKRLEAAEAVINSPIVQATFVMNGLSPEMEIWMDSK